MGKKLIRIFTFLMGFMIVVPLVMVIAGSFMDSSEIVNRIGTIFTNSDEMATWSILPKYPTMRPYVELLLDTPEFFYMYWNSIKQVVPGILGIILVAVPASWAFGRYEFKFKKILFTIYIALMIMPFQVTMVSSYIVLDRLRLLDTHLAIILPAIFSTFPIFIITKFFASIPMAIIESAKLDGANEWVIFKSIGIPLGKAGVISAIILCFLENWNVIEQPLIFLTSPSKWPLSLYLPNISAENLGIAMAASVIMMLPALLLFLFGQSYLEQGIKASGMKE